VELAVGLENDSSGLNFADDKRRKTVKMAVFLRSQSQFGVNLESIGLPMIVAKKPKLERQAAPVQSNLH
jgi:hypothetical protein